VLGVAKRLCEFGFCTGGGPMVARWLKPALNLLQRGEDRLEGRDLCEGCGDSGGGWIKVEQGDRTSTRVITEKEHVG
jgi:hypothetical protein